MGRIALVATLAVVGWTFAAQRNDRRGGPPGIFTSETPAYNLSVIQCDPTPTSVTLSLMSPHDLQVRIKTAGQPDRASVSLKSFVPQSIRVAGLGTEVDRGYELVYEGGSVKGAFRTPLRSGSSFVFDVQADSHLDQNSSLRVYTQTLQNMASDHPQFVVDLGDTFMTGKHANYRDAVKQYRAQSYYFGLVDAPWFLALGNHDGEQGWVERNQNGMSEWASDQRKLHFPPPLPGSFVTGNTQTADFFTFTWGDAQMIVLDPYTPTRDKPARSGDNWTRTLGKTQYDWLVKTLQTTKPKYRFVFIHHLVGGNGKDARGGVEASPFYEWGGKNPNGSAGFASNRPGWLMPIHDLLVKYGVNGVFHGHDHFYAHQERDGMVYQLVPQPGHERGDSVSSASEYTYQSGKLLGSSGYMRVSVSPHSAKVEYVKTSVSGGKPTVADSYEFKAP